MEGFAIEELGQHLANLRNTGRAADEDDLVDLVFSDFISALTAVRQHFLDTGNALLEFGHAELLELIAVHEVVVVLTIGESVNLDLSSDSSRKSFLGILARRSESVHGTLVARDIDASLGLEVILAEFDKPVVDVLATEMGVAISGFDRDNAIIYGKEGDIEGAATEVEDQNELLLLGL